MSPSRRTMLSLVVLALALVQVVVGSTALYRSHRDEFAWRDVAVRASSLAVSEYVDFHGRALVGLAERFGGWEALPPEAAQRALEEVHRTHPALKRLFLVDSRGSTVAQVGGPGRPFVPPATVDKAKLHVAPSKAGGDWLEIVVPLADGRFFAGADLALEELTRILGDLVKGGGIGLILEARGVVVVPRGARLPDEAWHYDLGAGLKLHVTFQPASQTGTSTALLVAVLISGLMATALVLLLRRVSGVEG